jgi:CPA2 family monovalent cation:H+ antiporter-2
VGYGRVGGTIGAALSRAGVPFVVVEQDRARVEELRRQGIPAIYGDAARPGILEHAELSGARLLVIAAPDPYQTREVIEIARRRNPSLEIVVRTHSAAEQAYLEKMGVGRVFMGERELALGMAQCALRTLGESDEKAERTVEWTRQETSPEPAAKG